MLGYLPEQVAQDQSGLFCVFPFDLAGALRDFSDAVGLVAHAAPGKSNGDRATSPRQPEVLR
jgi:hypothetical protein